MANIEVHKVETEYGETGLGQANRIDTTYELRADVDGVSVPFARVTQAQVDAAKARQEAERAAQPQAQPSDAATQPSPPTPTPSAATQAQQEPPTQTQEV